MNLKELVAKYGEETLYDFTSSLIGSSGWNGLGEDYYGIDYDDVDDILEAYEDVVYQCGACGWYCDGGDRDEHPEFDEDCCSDCVEYPD